MSKYINKKYLIIAICIIILSIVYIFAQKAIDNFVFDTDSDSYAEDNNDEVNKKIQESSDVVSNVASDEELDLVIEESEGGEESQESEGNATDKVDSEEKKIYVYITGEINNPGVLILNEGSRIVDAINAAGGATTKADTSKINLVYVLNDGMKVNIPNKDDLKNDSNFEYITMNSGDWRSSAPETSSSNSNLFERRSKKFQGE